MLTSTDELLSIHDKAFRKLILNELLAIGIPISGCRATMRDTTLVFTRKILRHIVGTLFPSVSFDKGGGVYTLRINFSDSIESSAGPVIFRSQSLNILPAISYSLYADGIVSTSTEFARIIDNFHQNSSLSTREFNLSIRPSGGVHAYLRDDTLFYRDSRIELSFSDSYRHGVTTFNSTKLYHAFMQSIKFISEYRTCINSILSLKVDLVAYVNNMIKEYNDAEMGKPPVQRNCFKPTYGTQKNFLRYFQDKANRYASDSAPTTEDPPSIDSSITPSADELHEEASISNVQVCSTGREYTDEELEMHRIAREVHSRIAQGPLRITPVITDYIDEDAENGDEYNDDDDDDDDDCVPED